METTAKSFNETHAVSDVLKGKVGEDLPTNPNEIDLRFLRMIHLTDTFDGDDSPESGTDYVAVLYGNQIVWQRDKFYWHGEQQMREVKGNELYRKMYYASQVYLKVQAVARAKFLRKNLQKGADIVHIGPEEFVMLLEPPHPQWEEMVRDFGFQLKEAGTGRFQVVVTKFYERATS